MILLIDIGNTTIGLALATDGVITSNYRLNTNLNKSYDELYLDISGLIDVSKVKEIAISSVVPRVTELLVKVATKFFNINPFVVNQGVKTGIFIKSTDPKQVGSDLICDLAGLPDPSLPTLVIDLGTANKYLYIENNSLIGAVISPGIPISIKALVSSTALLPDIDLIPPSKVLGTNTITSMQSGVVYGTVSEIEGLVEKIRKEVNKKFEIYITGGLSNLIAPLLNLELTRDKLLVFKGLLKIFDKNRIK